MYLTQHISKFLTMVAVGFTTSLYAECDLWTVQCIEKHVACLTATPFSFQGVSFSTIYFDNPLIKECVHDIEQSKSFKPLEKAWHILKEKDSDEVVLGEYSLLLLFSYHAIFSQFSTKNRLTWLSIVSLYAQLSMIPLSKLFDSLEECYNQYQAIMETFGPEKDESWISWSQNYWWVPTTIIIFTGLSFMRWYRARLKQGIIR